VIINPLQNNRLKTRTLPVKNYRTNRKSYPAIHPFTSANQITTAIMHELAQVSFTTTSGTLKGILHYPRDSVHGCIITCHGLFSSKDSDKFHDLAGVFSKNNYVVFRFDFRGCGESDGRIEDTTVSGRIEDLKAALAFVKKEIPLPTLPIGLLGSSMGGYISLHLAAFDASVKAVVAWATPFSFEGLREVIEKSNQTPLKETFYRDANHYTVTAPLSHIKNLLIIHGDKDELVPLDHAQKLYQFAHEPKKLTVVPEADHTFSNPHLRKQAVLHSLDWFNRYLNP
jgi:dipeptidyl aminopeptidase/acylaminoacyl peptidase